MDTAASFSILGVWNSLLEAVSESQNGTEVSSHPISSTRNTTILGCLPVVCCAFSEGAVNRRTDNIHPVANLLPVIFIRFLFIVYICKFARSNIINIEEPDDRFTGRLFHHQS